MNTLVSWPSNTCPEKYTRGQLWPGPALITIIIIGVVECRSRNGDMTIINCTCTLWISQFGFKTIHYSLSEMLYIFISKHCMFHERYYRQLTWQHQIVRYSLVVVRHHRVRATLFSMLSLVVYHVDTK